MQQQTSINSKYYINKIESDIVNLTKTISVEHQKTIEEAKYITRKLIQARLNQIVSDEEKEDINWLYDFLVENTKKGSNTELCKKLYSLFTSMELEKFEK